MNRLATMRNFVEVVHGQGFAEAAQSLRLSRDLVSRRVADLQRQLGLQLIVRTNRTIKLTKAGQRYFKFSNQVLTQIDTENAEILGMRAKAEKALSVVSPKWIGTLDLGDAVANFAVEQRRIHVKFARFETGALRLVARRELLLAIPGSSAGQPAIRLHSEKPSSTAAARTTTRCKPTCTVLRIG